MKKRKTLLHNLNIINTIRKFDMWGCGCDYLRLCYKEESDFIESSIQLVDTDNSSFFTRQVGGHLFTIQKGYCTLGIKLDFSISYNDVSVPVAQFVKYNEHNSYLFKSYGKFDFYGSMFRLIDMGYLEKSIFLLLKVLISEENPKVTRFDYRIDFFSSFDHKVPAPKEFCNYLHKQTKYKGWYKSNGDFEDWIIGKNSQQNNRYALRYYDKLLDSDHKGKMFLYQDYFKFKCVHRCEIEFQPNFLRGYTFYDFYDGLIQDKIESILGIGEKLFHGRIFYKYDESYIIDDSNRSQYLKRYCSSSVRLAKNGINPFIQCYKSLFYNLDADDLNKNFGEFLEFFSDGKNINTLVYTKLKNIFLKNHTI